MPCYLPWIFQQGATFPSIQNDQASQTHPKPFAMFYCYHYYYQHIVLVDTSPIHAYEYNPSVFYIKKKKKKKKNFF
jgi:hypothetical protein